MLDTSIFVDNLDASIAFYTGELGLELLGGSHHYPGNADMAFVGNSWDAYFELVCNLETHRPYAFGSRVQHLALEVDDPDPTLMRLRVVGVHIARGPTRDPDVLRRIAFIVDPNGIPSNYPSVGSLRLDH